MSLIYPIKMSKMFKDVSSFGHNTSCDVHHIDRMINVANLPYEVVWKRCDQVTDIIASAVGVLGEYDHRQSSPNPTVDELIRYANDILIYAEPFKTSLNDPREGNYGDKVVINSRRLEIMRDWLASGCTLKFRQDRYGYPEIRMNDVFPPSPAYYPKPPEYWDRPMSIQESLEAKKAVASQAALALAPVPAPVAA